jgi:hypothetical protein
MKIFCPNALHVPRGGRSPGVLEVDNFENFVSFENFVKIDGKKHLDL